MLEKEIEDKFVAIALNEYECLAIKFKRPSVKGGADRLVFCPAGGTFFIEFKRPGGEISEHQKEFKELMKNFSKRVYFCFTLDHAIEVLKFELKNYDRT